MKKIQGSRDFLRQEILSGYYKQGTYLPSVRCLAVRLKLSKSSVHNILKMLQEEGLLVLNPGRGALAERVSRLAASGAKVIAVGMNTPTCLIGLPESVWQIGAWQYDELAVNAVARKLGKKTPS